MNPTQTAVSIQSLSHRYGKSKTLALDNVSLTIPRGVTVGLIGPDGVGKSTLLSLMAGVRVIQQGEVTVLGGDMASKAVRRDLSHRIAYMPQGLGKNLYPTLSVYENIDFHARLFGLNTAERKARIARLLAATGLAPFPNRAAGKLSGGMKQKLSLCCALVHSPDLLILDEPTTGVDPLSRRQFWALVNDLRAEHAGMTVVVATAYIEEAEQFEHLLAMDAGKLLVNRPTREVMADYQTDTLEEAYIQMLPPEKQQGSGRLDITPFVPDPASPPAMEAHGLTKRFGQFTAVDHVSFKIEKGEIFGFLGSNGCGKSTTMKMLTGLLPATEGDAELLGAPIDAGNMATRMRVGYMSQAFSLYEELSVRQNLKLHAKLYQMGSRGEAAVNEALQQFDLQEVADTAPASLPLGIRQRLQLAAACLHHPEVLILDEPTSGVDPAARDMFWRTLLKLSREDKITIFVSTHFMNEAERCDRISFMHKGRVLAVGTPDELVAQYHAANLEEAFIHYLEEDEAREAAAEGRLAESTVIQQHHTTIASNDIIYYTAGNPHGQSVLLLHGGGVDSALLSWQEVMQQWAAADSSVYLVAPDLPGYGGSAKPDTVYSSDFYTDFVEALIKEIGLSKMVVCGLSMGGNIALQFALQYPQQIEKLVLVAPWGISRSLPWKRFGAWYVRSSFNRLSYRLCASRSLTRRLLSASLFGNAQNITPEIVEAVRSASLDQDAGKAFQSFQINEIYGNKPIGHLLPQLPNLKIPTLFVQGENDPGILLADVQAAARTVPNAQIEVFAGHKHWPQKESPQRFVSVLQAFCATAKQPFTDKPECLSENLNPNSNATPSPVGEGWGEGKTPESSANVSEAQPSPLPNPPPRGREQAAEVSDGLSSTNHQSDTGTFPPQLAGEGQGGGVSDTTHVSEAQTATRPLAPSRQRVGEQVAEVSDGLASINKPSEKTDNKPECLSENPNTRNTRTLKYWLATVFTFAVRETKELLRDKIRLFFAVIGPVIMLASVGWSVSYDVRDLKFSLLDRDQSVESRRLAEYFRGSPYFVEVPPVQSPREADTALVSQRAVLVIDIPPDFGRNLALNRQPEVAFYIDGAVPFNANTVSGYTAAMMERYNRDVLKSRGIEPPTPAAIEPRFLYNQDFKSLNGIVPNILVMVLVMIPAVMTALSVVREREIGSIANLYASPASVGQYLFGKQLPYLAMGAVNFAILSTMIVFWFGVPMKGSLLALLLGSLLLVGASTGLGLLVSSFTRSQTAAFFIASLGTMIPTMNFSGIIHPLSSLSGSAYAIGMGFPASWFQRVSMGGFTKGLGLADFATEYAVLAAFGLGYLMLASVLLKKQEK